MKANPTIFCTREKTAPPSPWSRKMPSPVPLYIIALSAVGITNSAGAPKQERPNIIFILTDDHRWDAIGYAGNNIVQTPEIDRLAAEGTYFRNAFVTTPISAASRASILTGLYERTHGYTFGQGQLKQPFADISYPAELKKGGYYTGFFGKFGVEYNDIEELFHEADVYDRLSNSPDRRGYFYKTLGSDTVHLTRYTSHHAQEFIRAAPDDKPFCLSLSFSAPHAHDEAPEQYIWQERSNATYENTVIPDPPLGGDEYFERLPEEVRQGYNRTRWHWRFDTPRKYQDMVKGYYRMISEIDNEIGALRKLLEKKGIAGNTIIIFMGDNGYFLGERQLAGKWLMYDNSLRVPFIIYDPGAVHNDIDDMVLNIDVPSTILGYAGVSLPQSYQGISLIPYVENGRYGGRRPNTLFEHLWELPAIPSSEGIRTGRWKYFRYRFIDAPEELYDLQNDPAEAVNLASDEKYGKVLLSLRLQCDGAIERYNSDKAGILGR